MPILLRIYAGADIVDLTSDGTMSGVSYVPTPVSVGEAMQPNGTTTDKVEILLQGNSATMVADVQTIESYFARAARRQETQTGDRVYLEYTLYSGAAVQRSEILDGYIEADQNPALRRFDWGTVKLTGEIVRRPYWEGTEQTLVNGTTIANGESGNYVDIASASILGSLPAPMRIELENNTGVSKVYTEFFYAANAFNDPTSFDGFLAGASLSWGAATDHTTTQHSYSLSAAMLADLGGDRFHVVAAFTAATDFFLRAQSEFSLTTMETSLEQRVDTNDLELVDLGTLRLPPGGANNASSNIDISLTVRDTSSGSGTLDFCQLLPASEFRRIEQIGYNIPAAGRMVDDGIENRAYVLSGASEWPLLVALGRPVHIWPGQDNRVYMLANTSNGFDASMSHKVYIKYRPRRSVV